MRAVTAPAQHPTHPPVGRWRVLLVLGLLAGLLGMHALAPGGTLHEHTEPKHMVATVGAAAHADCAGDGDCGGGHLRHADPTCMAASVNGGPTLPALVPDPVTVPVRAASVRSYAAQGPDGARAPPDLAELQLLRI